MKNLTIMGYGCGISKKSLTYHCDKIIALPNPKKLQGKRSVSWRGENKEI